MYIPDNIAKSFRTSSPSFILLASLVVLLSIVIGTVVYRLFFHPLASIPGPLLARCSTLWQNYHYVRGTWHDDILLLHETYGPVVRISHYEVSFVDADALKRIYGHQNPCKKTNWYNTWNTPHGHGTFSEQDFEKHSILRRRVAQAYAMTSILSYEQKIQKLLDINWLQFEQFAKSNESIDMEHWAQYFAYDVVSELALGRAFGMLKNGTDVGGYMRAVLGNFFVASNLGHVPGQRWWSLNPVSKALISLFGSDTLKGTYKFRQFMQSAVQDRFYSTSKPDTPDMLQHFIEGTNRDGTPATFSDVIKEAGNVLGAGADTTSIGIRAILYQIISYPETYRRIREEIDIFYEREITDGSEITYKQCQTLPYLQAVIKEACRLHPSIVYQIPRYSPAEGITIDGHIIPPGWPVGISALSMNRSSDIFGVDANEFNPERWLEDDKRARYMDSLLATFGMGPRTCIGKNIALVEMNKWIAQFFRHFDAVIVNKERPFKVRSFWFATQEEFYIRLSKRIMK